MGNWLQLLAPSCRLGLSTVQGSFGLRSAQIMASALLAALPILEIVVIFQRHLVQGIASSATKG